MERKSVLVVSATQVFPCAQGNRQVIRQLLAWLRGQGYHVTFVLQFDRLSASERFQYGEVCDHLIVVGDFLKRPGLRHQVIGALRKRLSRAMPFLGQGQSRPSGFKCWEETVSIVEEIVSKNRIHAVVAQYYFMTPIFDPIRQYDTLRVVQTHDALSLVEKKIGHRGADTQGREISPSQEAAALGRAQVVVAIEESEAAYFRKIVPSADVVTVGYASENICSKPTKSKNKENKTVLFIGSANPLNARGILWFLELCWPLILSEVPDAKLRICGTVCNLIKSESSNVEMLGMVPNLEDEWAQADVFINPVDLGTGLKIKTIEALSLGKAIVAVFEAAAGIRFSDDGPLIVEDSPEAFANQVAGLLSNNELRAKLEDKAIRYAASELTLEKTYQGLLPYFSEDNH